MDAGLRSSSSGQNNPNGQPSDPSHPSGPSGPATSGPTGPSGSSEINKTSPDVKPPSTGGITRGPSTKDFLKIHWDYPVYDGVGRHGSVTGVVEKHALPRDEALRIIAAGDPRPLLVLRECPRCNKTDRALLTPGADNERTLVLARWFHCVKLPVDIVEPDHPFHALFPDEKPEHLFVALADGSNRAPLEADTSRTRLWAAMTRVLNVAYGRDIASVSKEVLRHFDRLDNLDERARELNKRRDDLMQAPHVDPARVTRLSADLDELKVAIGLEKEQIEKLTHLELRTDATPEAEAKASPERPAAAGIAH